MFQLPNISFADIRVPTDEEEELGRGFRTLSNYVEAWSIYLQDKAGPEPKCPLKSISGSPKYSGLRIPDGSLDLTSKALSLSWSTEMLMRLQMDTLGQTEPVRFINAWLPIQAYYAVFNAVVAFNDIGGSVADRHRAHLNAIDNFLEQRAWLPSFYRLACVGAPRPSHAEYRGLDSDIDKKVSNLTRIRDDSEAATALVAKSLKTTRIEQIEQAREEVIEREKRTRLRGGQWEEIAKKLMGTTVFDLLFRLRLRCNYRETETLIFGAWLVEDAWTFANALCDLTWHLLALLETLIAGKISAARLKKIASEFGGRVPNAISAPVLIRWGLSR